MEKLDIKPNTSVYSNFRYLPYKTSKALAEYIDNSTQSFFNNEKKLKSLRIEITYNEDEIIILDNALGMNKEEISKAVKLGEIPKDNSGRHQFGMGLKTASTWFSDLWTIESTTLNNPSLYIATFDIPNIIMTKTNTINLIEKKVPKGKAYTKIIMRNLRKKINGPAAKKIKKILSSTYKTDLKKGNIEILINGSKLNYVEPEIWSDNKYSKEDNKTFFEFEVNYGGKNYNMHGFAAIAMTGTTNENSLGFDLTKNERVITPNVKPEIISGKTNSFSYQRLFGEINFENLSVTQDKSDFTWDPPLQELIYKTLADKIKFLIKRANKLRKKEIYKPITKNELEVVEDQIKNITINLNNPENRKSIKNEFQFSLKKSFKFEYRTRLYYCEVKFVKGKGDFVTVGKISKKNKITNIPIDINIAHSFLSPLLNKEPSITNVLRIIVAKTTAETIVMKTKTHQENVKYYHQQVNTHFEDILRKL